MLLHDPNANPAHIPRHCTGCGARIWSLTTVTRRAETNPGRIADQCNDCADPDDRDPWELFTTGRRPNRGAR